MGESERIGRPIVIKALHKSFGDQTVLNGIDLAVERGETLAILGRSGTGKSVLLKLIIGLQEPDSGSIRIHGQEINGLALDELNEVRKKVGFLFQYAALYDSLTVEENVAFPLKRHAALSAGEQKERVRELLSSVGWSSTGRKCLRRSPVECKSEWDWLVLWLWSLTSCSSMSLRLGWIRLPREKSEN